MFLSDWSLQKFSAWLIIFFEDKFLENGQVQVDDNTLIPLGVDISRLEGTYAANSIPTVICECTLGREAISFLASNAHPALDKTNVTLRAQIWVKAREISTSVGLAISPWPEQPFMLIDGRITNVGYVANKEGQATLAITISHFLVDLNFSSAISRSSNVANPGHFYSPAGLFIGTGADGQNNNQIVDTIGASYFTNDSVFYDLWGGRLQPRDWLVPASVVPVNAGLLGLLLKLTESDLLHIPDVGLSVDVVQEHNSRGNYEARDALFRFEPLREWDPPRLLDAQYVFGRRIALDNADVTNAEAIATGITQIISRDTFIASSNHTIWDKLVSAYANEFLLTVVPMSDRVLVVPMVPGLREHYKTIYEEEYTGINLTNQVQRPLYGMTVLTSPSGLTGALPQIGGRDGPRSIGGAAFNPNNPSGMVQIRRGPSWLDSMQTQLFQPQFAQVALGNALFGIVGNPFNIPPAADNDQIRNMLNRFAAMLYVTEALKDRGGTLSGRFRLDIGPGSSVRIAVSEEPFVAAARNVAPQTYLYATVSKVSFHIDTEKGSAGTNFDLRWVRNAAENVDVNLSLAGHPLFRASEPNNPEDDPSLALWTGAPIIPNPEVQQESLVYARP